MRPKKQKKEVKKEEPKQVGSVSADSKMYLATDSYIYKEPNEKSQRTWLLKVNTEFKVNPAEGDWVAVVAGDGKRGFVKRTALMVAPMDQKESKETKK